MVHASGSTVGKPLSRNRSEAVNSAPAVEQQAVVGGRRSVRRYALLFDDAAAADDDPGPGRLVRSSRITDSWGMRPRLDEDPGWRRTLPWYSLVYVYCGSGVYYSQPGDPGLPIEPGDVICLFPGIPHAYAPAARDRWDEINVDFFGRVFDAWRGPGLLDPAEPIRHLEPVAYWLHQFEHLAMEVAGSRGGHGLRDAGRLIELIGRMADDWRPDVDKETSEWIEAAKDRLDPVASAAEIDYDEIAAEFGIGKQAFRKKFRRLTGLTPSQYRSRRLIERACLLLEQTNQTGRSISIQLGFESEFYFSRRFKQLMGVSPRVYRERAGHGNAHSVVEDRPRAWSGRGGKARRRRNA